LRQRDLENAGLVSAELPFKKAAGVGEDEIVVEIEKTVAVGEHDIPAM
jgi:hypothetical protein